MKGIIFTTLNNMIEEQYGLETWDKLITRVNPSNKGAYTAGGFYNDKELFAYITELAKLKNAEAFEVIEEFGFYLFPVLAKNYPSFLPEGISFKEFMKSIDNVIHVEVNKLYPDTHLPVIHYEEPSPNQVVLLYQSPRKLCALAIGLTKGAADYFNVPINIQQPLCMLRGDDHCRLEINIER